MRGKLGAFAAMVLLAFLALPALAATEDTVNATVTPVVVSVTLSPTSVPYGVQNLSVSDGSRAVAESATITATNNGSVEEDFFVRGTNATPAVGSEATWVLNCTPASTGTVASDQYVHRFDLGATFDTGSALALCTANQSLIGNLAASGTQQFVLQLNMPTATTGSSQRSMTVTVLAVM